MAEFVQLIVQVDKSQLQSLQAEVTKLNGSTIDINVNNPKLAQAAGNLEKISESFRDGQLIKSVKDVNRGFGETERIITKIGKDGVTVTNEITRNLKYQKEIALGAEQAYEKYSKTIENTQAPTALQKQIDAITGVSNEFKSAKDSADFFRMRGLTPLEKELNKLGDEAAIAARKTESLWDNFQKFARWYLIGNVIVHAKRAIDGALDTMREVDQELTNIAKVSDLTAREIQQIGDAAYDTASKYGVAAEEYLQAVYTFQKAGLGDSATKMAELATKTMLVGDTTADIATQFLISANAAWKYGGNIEQLSRIVDEADKLNNSYAVTLEDIAVGLPIVGATAAQVGMTTEQTMAAISTIVASTGQSATKAATALRAIIMNLIGQTGELDDGLVVTEETIASLNTVLNQYAAESLKAAEAEGKILDPMEAIAALAKAAEDGFLNQAQLFEILSGLGGKLRTTQLTALVNNTEMYNSMLQSVAGSAGTADREIGIMLDSWNAKTQILQNTWNQFVAHLVASDGIKAVIDLMTALVKALDSGVGKVGALSGAIFILYKVVSALLVKTKAGAIVLALQMLTTGAMTAAEAVGALTAAMLSSPLFWSAAIAATIYGYAKALDALSVSYDEQRKTLSALEEQYNNTYGSGSELDQLRNKTEELTDLEKARLAVLENEADALQDQIKKQKELSFLSWRNGGGVLLPGENVSVAGAGVGAFGEVSSNSAGNQTAQQVAELTDKLKEAKRAYAEAEQGAADYKREVQEMAASIKDEVEAIQLGVEAGVELTDKEKELLAIYDALNAELTEVREKTEEATNAANDQVDAVDALGTKFKSQIEIYNEVSTKANILTQAMNEMAEAGGMTSETMQALIEQFPELQSELVLTENGWVINTQAIREHYEALLADYQLVYDNAVSAAQKIVDTEALKAAGFNATTMSIKNQLAALALLYESKFYARRIEESGGLDTTSEIAQSYSRGDSMEFKAATQYREAYQKISAAEYNLNNAKTVLGALGAGGVKTSGGSGGGGSKSSKSASSAAAEKEVDTVLEGLKAELALEKQRLSLMEESGASLQDRIAQMRTIQGLLHKQADHLRQFEGTEKEVLSLSTEWWSITNKINKEIDSIKETADEIVKTIEQARDAELARLDDEEAKTTSALQMQLDALEAQRDAIKDAREEEEKRLAVEEARIALENAQNERNIRQYNAATGQWEWVANEQTVAGARETLANAERALADYELDARITTLKAQIAEINDEYDKRRSAVEDQADADIAMEKEIAEYRTAYAQAKARGDAAGMQAANDAANAVRRSYGKEEEHASVDIAKVRGYDSGGILRGIGGIKATRDDEMVIPPSLTSSMLNAERNGSFDSLLNHLGIVTAAANGYAGFGSSVNESKIGSQHNGNVYNFNGMEITSVTENTTMGEFLMKVKTLSLYSGG